MKHVAAGTIKPISGRSCWYLRGCGCLRSNMFSPFTSGDKWSDTTRTGIHDSVIILKMCLKGSFTHTVNVAVFVGGTFDLFDVMCKQHHRTALKPF